MRSIRKASVALVILCAALRPLAAADAPKPLVENPGVASAIAVFDAWVTRTAADREQPGVSIGIVYDQDLIWSKGYGFADLAKKTPATPVDGLPDRLDLQSLHRDRDPSAARRGKARPGRSGLPLAPRVRAGARGPREPRHQGPPSADAHLRHPARGRGRLLERHEVPIARGDAAPAQPRGSRRAAREGVQILERRPLAGRLHRREGLGRALCRLRHAPHPSAAGHVLDARDSAARHGGPRHGLRTPNVGPATPRQAVPGRRVHGAGRQLRVDRRGSGAFRLSAVSRRRAPEARRS